MTKLSTLACLAAALTLGLATSAEARDIDGSFSLSGRYSNGSRTQANLRVDSDGWGNVSVTRTGRLSGHHHRRDPSFTWVAAQAVQIGHNQLRVTYQVHAGPVVGASGRINGRRGAAQWNVFVADYIFSFDRRSVREIVRNQTCLGQDAWWRTLQTSGFNDFPSFRQPHHRQPHYSHGTTTWSSPGVTVVRSTTTPIRGGYLTTSTTSYGSVGRRIHHDRTRSSGVSFTVGNGNLSVSVGVGNTNTRTTRSRRHWGR
jgi:hypothetical protein